MKLRKHQSAWTLWLLLLPATCQALGDLGPMLWEMTLLLLVLAVAAAGVVWLSAFLLALPAQLTWPEPASRAGRWAYGLRIWLLGTFAGLALGALGWFLLGAGKPYPSLLARGIPPTGLLALSLGAGAFLRRQRPTAAKALGAGLATAGAAMLLSLYPDALAKPTPLLRGVIGLPLLVDSSLPADSFVVGETTAGRLYQRRDQPPGFRGGYAALKSRANQALRYPDAAHQAAGIVQVAFTVQASGRLANPHVTTSLNPTCDAEALRVLATLAPYFTPGIEQGRPAATELELSFSFR